MFFVFSLKGSFSILPPVPFHVFILSFFPHKSTTFISFFSPLASFFLSLYPLVKLLFPLCLPVPGGGAFRGGASPNSLGFLLPFSRGGFQPLSASLRSLDLYIGQGGVRGLSGEVKPGRDEPVCPLP